jgi:hypothetical protein
VNPEPRLAHRLLLSLAVLCGVVAIVAGGGALVSSAENLRDPGWRCEGVDSADYTACLEQAQLATPFNLNTGWWSAALAAAICCMVTVMVLVSQARRSRPAEIRSFD